MAARLTGATTGPVMTGPVVTGTATTGGAAGPTLPRIPDSITDDQVSREVRDELGSLSFDRASTVGRYLVAAELATDPEQAYRYAQAAKQLAARVGVVREVSGIMAYKSGRWAEALTELQAGRRMTGRNDYLPLMADSERGLGRLDRALDLVHSAEAKRLPRAAQIELRIVESGIRRDQGLADAAVLALAGPRADRRQAAPVVRPPLLRLRRGPASPPAAPRRPGRPSPAPWSPTRTSRPTPWPA